MLQKTRLQITLSYLVITVFICSIFSFQIYQNVGHEIEESVGNVIEYYQKQVPLLFNGVPVGFQTQYSMANFPGRESLIQKLKHQLAVRLVTFDAVVLVLAGALGYGLSGLSLAPVYKMIAEQKRFVSDAAHELKTPLTSLRSEIEVTLRDKSLTLRSARGTLESNLEEIKRLDNLTETLLETSRATQTAIEPVKNKTNIEEVVSQVCKILEPQIKDKNISLKVDVPTSLKARIDGVTLSRILTIVIENAIKYNQTDGTIDILANKVSKNTVISVQDSGIGIDQLEIAKIFNRFYRGDEARTKTETNGFGLGLSIADELVKQFGGQIDVQSTVGKGSKFTIKLPD